MQTLKDVIGTLRRELQEALDQAPRESGNSLVLEKVVLSLDLAFQEQRSAGGKVGLTCGILGIREKNSPEMAAGASKGSGHQLIMEFRWHAASTAEPVVAERAGVTSSRKIRVLEGEEAERVSKSLAEIFGAPGFDSSARATVFREAVSELTDEQFQIVLHSLQGGPVPELEQSKRARHLISGVLKSGPMKSVEKGGELLEGTLEGFTLDSVVRLVTDRWKTQEEWLG